VLVSDSPQEDESQRNPPTPPPPPPIPASEGKFPQPVVRAGNNRAGGEKEKEREEKTPPLDSVATLFECNSPSLGKKKFLEKERDLGCGRDGKKTDHAFSYRIDSHEHQPKGERGGKKGRRDDFPALSVY